MYTESDEADARAALERARAYVNHVAGTRALERLRDVLEREPEAREVTIQCVHDDGPLVDVFIDGLSLEEHDELLSVADDIAACVGIDPFDPNASGAFGDVAVTLTRSEALELTAPPPPS